MTKPKIEALTITLDGPVSCSNGLREQLLGTSPRSNDDLRTLAISFALLSHEIMAELGHRAVIAERQRNEAESQRIAAERRKAREVWMEKELRKLPTYKARKTVESLDLLGQGAFDAIMSMTKHYCKVHKGLKSQCGCKE